jgi:hypothetical protein
MTCRRIAVGIAVALLAAAVSAAPNAKSITRCQEISQPGSYELANVINATQKDLIPGIFGTSLACIWISAPNVTLDLQGYTISGPIGSPPPAGTTRTMGIQITNSNVRVHSGFITRFHVGLFGTGRGLVIEKIDSSENEEIGISLQNFDLTAHRVIGNVALINRQVGIRVTCPAIVIENIANGNGAPFVATVRENQIQVLPGTGLATDCPRENNSPSP